MLELMENGSLNSFLERLRGTSEEWEIKAKRCCLHFLVNLMSSLKHTIVELTIKMQEETHLLYSIVEYAFFGYFCPQNQEKIKNLEEKEPQLYDEWTYLFLINCMLYDETDITIKWMLRSLDTKWFDNRQEEEMGESVKVFFEYLFGLMQKTVEKKIHFSVIRQTDTTLLDEDEYYASEKQKDSCGLQINFRDFEFLRDDFIKFFEVFEGIGPSSIDKATNVLEYLHWIMKLMIPISFLGGYNKKI